MKTLVVANLASGVGRSTVAALLVRYLIHRNQRVLAVDLDEQGSLGDTLRRSRQLSFAALRVDALLGQDLPHVPARAAVVIDGADALRGLAHQPQRLDHFIENLQDLVATLDRRFDACIIDTSAHAGIGLLAALACAEALLVPTTLTAASTQGVCDLFAHDRVGVRRVQAGMNPNLRLIGLPPTMVEPTPCQQASLVELAGRHPSLLIPTNTGPNSYAVIPRHGVIAQAHAAALALWEMSDASAREVWRLTEPSIAAVAARLTAAEVPA